MQYDDFAHAPKAPLGIIAAATCLALVVFTAPLTTLEAMTLSLDLTAAQQAWVMSAMPLGAACGLLTAGAFGDTLGRRRTFRAGLWLVALSSVLAGLAPNGPLLIGARVIQGLGTAGVMACGLGLLGQVYSGEAQKRATAIWAAALGGGVAIGPILASVLLSLGGWRADHWMLALAAALLALMSRSLPENPRTGARVDLPGSLLMMVGLGCLLSAMTEARVGSVGAVTALLVAAAVFLALFGRVERRASNPILAPALLREPAFIGATAAAFTSGAGVLALMSMVPTVLERGLGLAPLVAALILLAWSGVTVFSALAARFLPRALSSRQWVLVSISGCAIAQLLMLATSATGSWAMFLPGLFLAGVSNGVLNAALGHEAVRTVPVERAAMGSAANNTARYLGSALGIALISILLAGGAGGDIFTGWHRATLATAAFSVLGVLAILWLTSEEDAARA